MINDLKCAIFQNPADLIAFSKGGGTIPSLQTAGNVFPIAGLATKTLVVKISTDGGSTFPTTRTHTFGAGSYNSIADVVNNINADATFLGGGTPDLRVFAVGSELAIVTRVAGNRALKADATSTGIGVGLLQYQSDQVANGAVSEIVSIVSDSPSGGIQFWYL